MDRILVAKKTIVNATWYKLLKWKLKPGSKVIVHKSQEDVPDGYVRIRYGDKKNVCAVLHTNNFKRVKKIRLKKKAKK